jgi:hypothetical protein
MSFTQERLYELLPAFDRVRDSESGRALEMLIEVIAGQVAVIEEDLAQLYDDHFIETCAPWAVPYIGDLIGYRALRGTSTETRVPRAEVADTIGFRRRKGTAAMLEQLARDVTSWNARVVEFFQLLGWTQHMQHIRPAAGSFARISERLAIDSSTGNLIGEFPRLWTSLTLEDAGSPFDPLAHTVDVRRIASGRGRYNIPNVGVFLWRLGDFSITDTPATPVTGDPLRYRFSQLGIDGPLFNHPEPEIEIAHLAEKVNVPGVLTRRELSANLEDYWGRALALTVNGIAVPNPAVLNETIRDRVKICNLSDDPNSAGDWVHMPADLIAIDPELGRIAFPAAQQPASVLATHHYAFSDAMGSGEYEREASFDEELRLDQTKATIAVPTDQPDIDAALIALGAQDGIIELATNDPQTITGPIVIATGQRVELRAANGQRPLIALNNGLAIQGNTDGELILNGLLVTGGRLDVTGRLRRVIVRHCTFVPGIALTASGDPAQPDAPSIVVAPDPANLLFTLEVDQSITGPIRMPADGCELAVTGSIVDAGTSDRAMRVRGFVSGALSPFPSLTSATPTMQVTIGEDGPYAIALASVPTTLAQAATALQAAIRGAGQGPAFSEASVTTVGDQLVVLAGTGERVVFDESPTDPSLTELALDSVASSRPWGVLSAPLTDPPVLQETNPKISLQVGALSETVTGITKNPADLDATRGNLQTRIRAANADQAFASAIVARIDNRLLVLAGREEETIFAFAHPSDAITVLDLGLSIRAAIGAEPDGEGIGPVATIDRSTINGPVVIREMPLASESILVDPVWTLRRQIGCMRFCFAPIGSRTPRRHRCQPADAQNANRIRPAFSTLRYGRAAYGQLSQACPEEISAGAADEAEMGAFHDLYQPQRVANLRLRLEEYLRFGLEAGIIFAT